MVKESDKMMDHFLKEVALEFLKNPVVCYRRLRSDRKKAHLWQQALLGGGSINVGPSNIPGVFTIDLESHVALRILEHGYYEEEITNFISSQTLKGGGVVVNIGANVGLMTVFLAQKFGRKTIAIEPNPEAFEFLQKNVAMNGLGERVTCIQACIGAQPGNVDFSFVRGKSEYSSMGGIVHPCVTDEVREILSVPVKPLGQVITDPVAFMLIDTEGAEGLVFEGAKEIIQKDHPVIVCECSDMLLVKFGASAKMIVNQLIDLGYNVCDLETGAALNRDVQQGFNGNIQAVYNG